MTDWMISPDDHAIEPPHVWETRLPARLRERGPRFFTDGDGPAWHFEDKRLPIAGVLSVLSRSADGKRLAADALEGISMDQMREGAFDPAARLADMTRDGVLASACYPTFARFCGQTFSEAKDRELGLACVKAYNDWMIDEWCGDSGGRLVPLVIMPLWDPALAAAELERCAGKGAKAFSFSENPTKLGYPSIYDGYWDPVISAASEAGLVFGIHIGSSSWIPASSADAPHLSTVVWGTATVAACSLVDWLLSGKLVEFPKVKICLSEGGIGWIPYFLERANHSVRQNGKWANAVTKFSDEDAARAMSGQVHRSQIVGQVRRIDYEGFDSVELFRKHFIACAFTDVEDFGFKHAGEIGIDNVTVEADYPHADTGFPNTLNNAKRLVAHLSPEDQYKVLQGNARRFFNINPTEPARTKDPSLV